MIDCDSPFEVVTTPGTTIITPNYPDDYPMHLDCQVTLKFEQRVSIVFEDFSVYGSSGYCDDYYRYSWLEVHDGENSDSPLIGEKLCGPLPKSPNIPSPMESSGNSMTLVFHSDYYIDTGFKIMSSQITL